MQIRQTVLCYMFLNILNFWFFFCKQLSKGGNICRKTFLYSPRKVVHLKSAHKYLFHLSWWLVHYGQSVPMHQYLGTFIATHLAKPWPVAQKSRNGVSSLKTRLTMSHFPILFSCFENYKHSSFWSFLKINVPLFLSNGSRSVGQRQWINIETPVLVI